ncbi:MAG TPA: TSUP family transporter [Niabella sp.]|nr:TSUP family transporter [Niabella sp.]
MSEVLLKNNGDISNSKPFPAFLKTGELDILIVGGKTAALEQLNLLLHSAPLATIKIVAESIGDDIRKLETGFDNVSIEERSYERRDIKNADLVIVTETSQAIIDRIVNDATHTGLTDIHILQGDYKNPYPVQPGSANTLSEHSGQEREKRKLSYKRIATYALAAFAFMLIGHIVFSFWPFDAIKEQALVLYDSLGQSFLIMLAAGFIAQLVDGALGMGYGVTSATILLSAGVNPAAISGSIHTAEMFASGASGYSHYKFGNVNKKLFKMLLIPGVIGAIAGAVLLVYLGEKYSDWVRPILACYTLFLGLKILYNAFKKQIAKKKFKHYRALAGAGGFFDSFGGGGWGPIVTTTLITKGRSPRYVIGSVSLTEFFVTLSSAFTFFILLGVSHWQTILGLIVGGLIAAPLAAKLAGRLPRKTSFILVGILVIVWSVRILIKLL